ncbi:hypothetical protein K474DRAFT_327970 [Panus rudis PR-1116 ss-1]|nr:hypothetical protein K474DRAFT_327970 [Panus rudis PR-1116 ss-1]
MDTLMSDQLLAPELCKLLQVKLQDTTAELDAAKQAIASLQIEMSGLRKGQTSVPGNSDCACTSAKEVERLRACIDEIQRNGVGTAKEVTSGLQNRVRNLETQLYRSRQEVRTFRQALAEINKDSGLDCIGTLAGFPAIDIPEMDALLPCISKKCQDPQKSVAGQFKAFLYVLQVRLTRLLTLDQIWKRRSLLWYSGNLVPGYQEPCCAASPKG